LNRLKIANDLTLPLDIVTQTVAVIAKRRAGKSYTMRRIAEQLFKAGQQIVIVDPKGDQWGIRSAADGKAPGLAVVILGGERGDVPLEVGAGEVVAKLVVEERVSVLLDLSLFRKAEVARFMTDFLENLYRLKAREIYRTPVMLVVDEADAIAPQKPQPGEERMLGAIEDIVRRGGQRGIGCVLVTQRSAVLNKNVLTQAQILVALRTIAPQDLKAMKEWIDVHGEDAERKLLMESLPSLPVGQAWFWSPGWPTNDGIFQRVNVLPIETFDSGATPKPGERRIEPKSAADVDLDALKRQMAATIEKAKADDPRELRKQIADLQRQATSGSSASKGVEKQVLTAGDRELLEKVAAALRNRADQARDTISIADERLDTAVQKAAADYLNTVRRVGMDAALNVEQVLDRVGLQKILGKLATVPAPTPQKPPTTNAAPRSPLAGRVAPAQATSRPARQVSDGGALPPGEHATLTAALQYPNGIDRKRLGILTGYKRSSRDAYIARLAQKGLVTVNGQLLYPTDTGRASMNGSFEPLPTGAALIEYWRSRLPEGERRTFEVVIANGNDVIDREDIDRITGYKRSSRDAYLVRLKARGLVEFAGPGQVRPSSELFD
jgi:hypothetical protein